MTKVKTQPDTLITVIYENSTGTYIAKAPTFATTNSAWWQIKFIDQSVTNTTTIKWADGDQYFDNILDNYLSLTYS